MNKGSKARFVNGVVSAAIVVFFLVHATLGSLSGLFGVRSPLAVFVWVGIGLVGVHVVACVVTSREQLNDMERPPSARKKRHLALKWATGGLLALAVVAHIVSMRVWGVASVQTSWAGVALTAVLAIALAVHVCVGAKSLLKDLNIDRAYMGIFRIVVCAFAAFFVIAAIADVLL